MGLDRVAEPYFAGGCPSLEPGEHGHDLRAPARGLSILFFAFGLAIVRGRLLPSWLGWVAFPLALVAPSPRSVLSPSSGPAYGRSSSASRCGYG